MRSFIVHTLKQNKWSVATVAVIMVASVAAIGGGVALWVTEREQTERLRYEQGETELIVSNVARVPVQLFKAGNTLQEITPVSTFNGERIWLSQGDYFLKVYQPGSTTYYPVPIIGYRSGPDADGAFAVTIRPSPSSVPPRLLPQSPEWVSIPSGHFLLGDRINPREPHYVWLPGFFMSPFEVTNAEFRVFLNDPHGYPEEANWTEQGRRWKSRTASQATALLKPTDSDFSRFGQPDQPVVRVTWFEAHAFCRWLTRKIGNGHWLFALPTEAEWEKAARGPDNFDYALSRTLSDEEVRLYNWKKNPDAPVTVVSIRETRMAYTPNRYGLYHMSGNVVEWTQSLHRSYNRQHPYVDDDRNHDEVPGQRVARGGSWYSASIALLYISYRDAFQPEVSNHDLGFRLVARVLP